MGEQDTEQTASQEATGTADQREDTSAPDPAPAAPLAVVTGLVTVGTGDAPACSDGVCL